MRWMLYVRDANSMLASLSTHTIHRIVAGRALVLAV